MELDALKKIEQQLRVRYLRSVCDLHLQYHRRRHSTENTTKMLLWIRSTTQKDSFAWAMVRAKCVREPYTQSQIMEATNLSRQSVSDMTKTCVSEGWIDVFCNDAEVDQKHLKHCKGQLKYMAGDEMMQLGLSFVERHIVATGTTYMNSNWEDLMAVRKTIDAIR